MDVPSEVERAVAQLEPGGQLVGVRALTGGVSADVFLLDIATAAGDRRRVVFRRLRSADFKDHDPTVTRKEHRVLAALHGRGFAVPEPYLSGDADAGSTGFLVMQWVDGSTELAADDLLAGLDQMAGFLVRLHALDPRSLQLPELEPVEDPAVAVIRYLPSTEAGRRAEAVLASGCLEPVAGPPVLLHGDYWPGNVLWHGGRLVGVIDWEDAQLGDPLADLATARVELLCQYGDEAMERFTDRYVAGHLDTIGSLRLDSLGLWELYVSASALATMGGWGLDPADEARRRARTERCFERAARRLGRSRADPDPGAPWRS